MVGDLGHATREGNADCLPVVTEGVAGLPGMGGIWTWDKGVVGVAVESRAVGVGEASDRLATNSPCATCSHIKQS